MNTNKICWLDLRGSGPLTVALVAEAVQQSIDGIVSDRVEDFDGLPPTVTRVLWLDRAAMGADTDPTAIDPTVIDLNGVDVAVVEPDLAGLIGPLSATWPAVEFGRLADVVDAASLEQACEWAATDPWTVLRFADTTRIPLEIVLAAAANAKGQTISVVGDPDEAEVVFGVLEHGPGGVLMAAGAIGQITRLKAAAQPRTADVGLTELEIVAVAHVGMGERACVDTCTYLRPDEGILVGSHSKGMVLCVSETHPLPYMPTRPFRVNAGALMSYTLATPERTQYLSELRSGSRLLAVDVDGHTRPVTVGRVKIETRPLLSIDAVGPGGQPVNLIVQDDWHVRVLGPGGAVLNSTTLKPGDRVLGYLPTKDRHVGFPIDEFCYEQ